MNSNDRWYDRLGHGATWTRQNMAGDQQRHDDQMNFIDRLTAVWLKHPELRLSQLIGNAWPHQGQDPYYIEDEPYISRVEAVYEQLEQIAQKAELPAGEVVVGRKERPARKEDDGQA